MIANQASANRDSSAVAAMSDLSTDSTAAARQAADAVVEILGFARLLRLELAADSPGQGWLDQIEAAAERVQRSLGQPEEPPADGPTRVLIAEDFDPLRELLRLQLQALGCEVLVAADGAEALQLWRQNPADLLITDLNMPVMDGAELTRQLRAEESSQRRRLPVIGLTASSEPAELDRCLNAGMDETLIKPIDLSALQRVLARWNAGSTAASGLDFSVPAHPSRGADAVLDLSAVYRMLGHADRAQALAIVEIFSEHARRGLLALRAHAGDRAELAREMHKHKSGARGIGARRYAEQAERLEALALGSETFDLGAGLAVLERQLAEIERCASSLAGS